MLYTYGRRGGYEVSSRGDKRFSALNAKMPDGRTIEMHYQCDVKGYEPGGRNWKLGKGKPPKLRLSSTDMYFAYYSLWKKWAELNPDLIAELKEKADKHKGVLSDLFASSPINQARALATILNVKYGEKGEAGFNEDVLIERVVLYLVDTVIDEVRTHRGMMITRRLSETSLNVGLSQTMLYEVLDQVQALIPTKDIGYKTVCFDFRRINTVSDQGMEIQVTTADNVTHTYTTGNIGHVLQRSLKYIPDSYEWTNDKREMAKFTLEAMLKSRLLLVLTK